MEVFLGGGSWTPCRFLSSGGPAPRFGILVLGPTDPCRVEGVREGVRGVRIPRPAPPRAGPEGPAGRQAGRQGSPLMQLVVFMVVLEWPLRPTGHGAWPGSETSQARVPTNSLGGTRGLWTRREDDRGEHGEQAGSRLQAGRWGRPRDGRAECMSPPISPPPPYPPGAFEAGMRQRGRDRWGGSGGAGTNGPAPPVYVCNGSGRATAMNPDRGPIGRWVWGGRLAEDPHPSK